MIHVWERFYSIQSAFVILRRSTNFQRDNFWVRDTPYLDTLRIITRNIGIDTRGSSDRASLPAAYRKADRISVA